MFMAVLFSGCTTITNENSLEQVADFYVHASFKTESDETVSIIVDHYQNGKRQNDTLLDLSSGELEKGNIHLSMIQLPDEEEMLIIGSINTDGSVVSNKSMLHMPSTTFSSIHSDAKLKSGEETMLGAIFFDEQSVSLEMIDIDELDDFIEAYEKIEHTYIVRAQIK